MASAESNKLSSPQRVLLVASGGGHWVQLTRISPAFADHHVRYVTTLPGTPSPIPEGKVSCVSDGSRDNPVGLAAAIVALILLIVSFRPHVVLSTGAAPGILALRLGKLVGAKTIWIDSIANAEDLSLSGKLARSHADLWLTQWPHLVERYEGLQSFGAVM
jgi:hypothetical protein